MTTACGAGGPARPSGTNPFHAPEVSSQPLQRTPTIFRGHDSSAAAQTAACVPLAARGGLSQRRCVCCRGDPWPLSRNTAAAQGVQAGARLSLALRPACPVVSVQVARRSRVSHCTRGHQCVQGRGGPDCVRTAPSSSEPGLLGPTHSVELAPEGSGRDPATPLPLSPTVTACCLRAEGRRRADHHGPGRRRPEPEAPALRSENGSPSREPHGRLLHTAAGPRCSDFPAPPRASPQRNPAATGGA